MTQSRHATRPRCFVPAWVAVTLMLAGSVPAAAQGGARLEAVLRAVTAGVADVTVDAAGLTRAGQRLWSVEPLAPADTSRPKVVLIGGLDGRPASAATVVRLLQWWYRDPSAESLRRRWHLAAVACARPGLCDADTATEAPPLVFPPPGGFFDGKLDPTPHYAWRWVTQQAPTLVVEIGHVENDGEWWANGLARDLVPAVEPPGRVSVVRLSPSDTFVTALETAGAGPAWSAAVPALRLRADHDMAPAALVEVLTRAAGVESPLRRALLARQARAPLDVARLLAPKYPAQPIMSYIPALAWSGALELAEMTGESRFRDKPLADMASFLSGARPAIAEPYQLTSLAGHLALSDLGAIDANRAAADLARAAADFILPQAPGEIVRFPRAWTDDMFMATSVLARVAARTGDVRYADVVSRLLLSYADDLQRADGVFIHAKEGPHAWGRGNGFAAFGLMEALTYLPESWPARDRVLDTYRRQMAGLRAHQAPDGLWRQVVDEPGSYREFTVTAMAITAMARGLRLAWLPSSYQSVVDRAWDGLLARIAEDGTLMDVCTGTGSGPTRDYYLNRAGISGADDRGGAMALVAAIEMAKLGR